MSPTVRKATLEDVSILLEFEQGVIKAERPFDPTIREGDIAYYDIPDLVTNSNSDVFIVEINNHIVASGYAKIKSDRHYLKHERQGYLGFMFVSNEHRGKQLNKLIINTLLEWCKSRGIFEIRLDVYDDNIPAIRAYEKVGFKKHMINMRLDIENMDILS